MSRIAKNPIIVPKNVSIIIENQKIIVKGIQGQLEYFIHKKVTVKYKNNILTFLGNTPYDHSWMHAGTLRSLVHSMIVGVTIGFSKKLILIGVGYRVAFKNKNLLNISLGYSHPIIYELPIGISAEIPSPTEIILKGSNKQLLGQVAANIRAYRKPEPYKGKGIRYENEIIRLKEAKKK